jgi:hypothetical protein
VGGGGRNIHRRLCRLLPSEKQRRPALNHVQHPDPALGTSFVKIHLRNQLTVYPNQSQLLMLVKVMRRRFYNTVDSCICSIVQHMLVMAGGLSIGTVGTKDDDLEIWHCVWICNCLGYCLRHGREFRTGAGPRQYCQAVSERPATARRFLFR